MPEVPEKPVRSRDLEIYVFNLHFPPGLSFTIMPSSNSEAPVLDTYHAVVAAYSDFLTVAIHTILYERNIYPQTSFIKARKYNYPVRQSRHPKVCKWIMDAVSSVETELLKVGLILSVMYSALERNILVCMY